MKDWQLSQLKKEKIDGNVPWPVKEKLPDVHFIQEQDDTFLIVLTGKDFTCIHELLQYAEACCSWNVVSVITQCTLRRERNASS